MKKLMIAAAIVCAAAMSQAAAIAWSVAGDGIGTADGMDYVAKGTAVYLINATTDQDAFTKAFTGADYASAASAANISSAVKVGNDGSVSLGAGGTTTLEGGLANQKAYFVIIDGDNMFVSDQTALSWVATGDGKYSTTFAAANSDASWSGEPFKAADGFQGAGWYQAAAIPEPTSGLLLLLGVAGLALRRRRA